MRKIQKLLVAVLIILIVGTTGYILVKKNYQPVTFSPTPQSNTPSSPTSISNLGQATATANWKIYTDAKKRYIFKYPSTFTVDPGENSVTVTVPNSDPYPVFYVDIINPPLKDVYNYDAFMSNLPQYITIAVGTTVSPRGEPFNGTFTRQMNIQVDGQAAYVFTSNSGEKRIVIPKNSSWYVIGGYYPDMPQFNQILSTFRVISK